MTASRMLESDKTVTRRFMEKFKNRHNIEVIAEPFSPKAVLHLPAEGLPDGPECQKTIGPVILAAFPDVHVEGRHRGRELCNRTPYRSRYGRIHGHSRHGKSLYWTENHFSRIENERISELSSEWGCQKLIDQIAR